MALFRSRNRQPDALADRLQNTWTQPAQIHRLLHTLKTQRTPVALRFAGEEDSYNTIILDASAEQKMFLMDELTPAGGNRKLRDGREFLIEAHVLGSEFSLRHLREQGTQLHRDAVLSKVPYPDAIHYSQRRGAFRIEVPPSLRAAIRLYGSYRDRPIKGRLLDLSGTGCKVRASGSINPEIRSGEPFERCEIEVPGFSPASVPGDIRFVEPNASIAATTFGIQFRDVSQHEEREIFRLVQGLQRHARRAGLT